MKKFIPLEVYLFSGNIHAFSKAAYLIDQGELVALNEVNDPVAVSDGEVETHARQIVAKHTPSKSAVASMHPDNSSYDNDDLKAEREFEKMMLDMWRMPWPGQVGLMVSEESIEDKPPKSSSTSHELIAELLIKSDLMTTEEMEIVGSSSSGITKIISRRLGELSPSLKTKSERNLRDLIKAAARSYRS